MSRSLLTVYHAGSLRAAFASLAKAFEESRPGVTVKLVPGGSVDLARRIQSGEPVDVFASADCRLIEDLQPHHVSRFALFARNRMVLAYRPDARGSEGIGPDNWYQVLLHPDTRFGLSDPNEDPGGYRALMVWKLAEIHYGQRGLFDSLSRASGKLVYSGERTLRFYEDFKSGVFDYALTYASSMASNGLPAVDLPPEIDLSDPDRSDAYAVARVMTQGLGGQVERVAEPILFGVAALRTSAVPALGDAFVDLLLSEQGSAALEGAGFQPITRQAPHRATGERGQGR
jgi:molybdate/tungstate transport system substrate-binding protein